MHRGPAARSLPVSLRWTSAHGPRVGLASQAAPPARVAAELHAATRHYRKDQCQRWWGDDLRGQPVVPVAGRLVPVRVLVWTQSLRRRVPTGFTVETTCRRPGCVAVKHMCLWPVRRIETRAHGEDVPVTCKRGHDLTDPAVARWSGGRRRCRVCALERDRAKRAETTWTHPDHVRGPDGRYPVCRRGHPLSGDNVVVESTGWRRCWTCLREREIRGVTQRQTA